MFLQTIRNFITRQKMNKNLHIIAFMSQYNNCTVLSCMLIDRDRRHRVILRGNYGVYVAVTGLRGTYPKAATHTP